MAVNGGVHECEMDARARVPYGLGMRLSAMTICLVLVGCDPGKDEPKELTEPMSTTGGTDAVTSGDPPTPTTSETGESGETGTTGVVPAVTFLEIYEQVILPGGCNAGYCHGGGAGGLEMTDEASTYAALVEMPAAVAMCGQTLRVAPGEPDASVLWYRVRPAALDGGMACAPKMPQGSMGLADEQAQLVKNWISGGALE